MISPMPFTDFERAYEELAKAIDRAGPDKEALFLARLALTLADRIGRLDLFLEAVAVAEGEAGFEPSPGFSPEN